MNRALPILLLPTLLVACGTDVSGPTAPLLSCVFGGPAALASGEVLQIQGPANEQVCVAPAGAGPGEFVYIPFFGTAATGEDEEEVKLALELDVLGAGQRQVGTVASLVAEGPVLLRESGRLAGPGSGDLLPGRDEGFHQWLRRREIEELTPLIRPAAGASGPTGSRGAVRAAGSDPVPGVGELLTFNVAISCSNEDFRTGEVMHVSDHAIVVADTGNPANLSPSDYAYFGITFDTLVYPVETAHFGTPADIDGNGRSILFFTRAVNERNARNATSLTIGFFWSGDLFPAESTPRLEACPGGNEAEMFYLIAPDPDAVVGPPFSLDRVRELAIPLIGHEFQHLVNASRRLFVNDAPKFEEPWLNEGLSHAAEELLYFRVAGLQPLMNLTVEDVRAVADGASIFNRYMAGNLSNYHRYLANPDTASLMGIDGLSTRGATWAFLRYAADRSEAGDEAFFFDLVNSRTAGLDNLAEVIGPAAPLDWMRDWTVSVYADDFVAGVAGRFTQPSWDLRSIFQGSTVEFYPLQVHVLTGRTPLRVDLLPGGAVYARFGIDGGGQAVVLTDPGRGAIPAGLRGSFLRTQ